MEYQSSFITKQVLRSKYGTLFEYQDILMEGPHRIYLVIAGELPNESDLHLDPL